MTTMDFTAPKFDGDGPVEPLAGNVRFGAATAAFQVEGATHADGRGESIWDRFCRTPGAVANGDTGDIACEHYRRWEADLDLMAALGLESYRFSIAWPRVQPTGQGAVNAPGLRFYRALAEGLRERGIEPIATLYHWDLPQALQDEGGWAVAGHGAAVRRVRRDLRRRARRRRDAVDHPQRTVGRRVPRPRGRREGAGIRDWPTALRVSHHLLLSHGLAAQALRASVGAAASVGIALNLAPVHAAGPGEDHDAAARRMDGHLNRWFLDPILRGRYPSDMLDVYERMGDGALGSEFRNGDLPVIAEPIDFLGVNYYFPQRVFAAPHDGPLGLHHAPAPPPTTTMGWEVDPGGLHDLLVRLRRDYGPLPVYITENGASFDDPPETEGLIEDPQRTAYLRGHLEALARAVADGVDVRRYCVWSLLDNFEWEHGYDKRFGIVHVDYRTQRRSPKRSALWYRDFIGWMRRLRG